MEQSAAVSISAIVAVVVSVLAVGLSVAFSYAARDGRWPFRLASASLAGPAAAIVLSVRAISSTVQGSAESGSGGLGFIAGGMSEAYGLLLYAAAVSLLLLVAVGLAGVIRWDESPPGTSVRRPLVILLGGIAFVSLPMVCLRELMGLIMAVAPPANSVAAATPYFGVPATLGQVSQRVVSLMFLAVGTGLASAGALFVASLLASHIVRGRLTCLGAIVLLGTSALVLAVLVGHSYFWSTHLREIAIRGSVPK